MFLPGFGSGFNISLDQDPYPVSVPLSDGRCPRLESIKFITFPFPFRTKNSSGGIIRGKVWRYNQSFFCTWPTTPLVTNYCWFSCTQMWQGEVGHLKAKNHSLVFSKVGHMRKIRTVNHQQHNWWPATVFFSYMSEFSIADLYPHTPSHQYF